MASPGSHHPARSMVQEFPQPGRLLQHAYRELDLALNGTDEQRAALGDLRVLPRPWDPDSLKGAALRRELWDWLEAFTVWLNTEHTWDVAGVVPQCWPQHPHLVRELAVLADQRRRATLALGSDALEDWHRYGLPSFTERMRQRLKGHCDDGHQPWPAKGRHSRHVTSTAEAQRCSIFEHDAAMGRRATADGPVDGRPHLRVLDGQTVDLRTGEIVDG